MKSSRRTATLLVLLIFAQLLVITSFQSPLASANPGIDDPRNIHVTFEGDPTTSLTVTWETTYSTSGDELLYDTTSRAGNVSEYGFYDTASQHSVTGASGYIHDAQLTNLTPDTIYYFMCGGPGNYSSERSFRTAPVDSTDFTFVIGGDSRSDPFRRSQVSEAMRHFNPSFVMHSADMVEDGRIQAQWESWFADVDANWTGDNGLTIPVIPSLGNHEFNSSNYYEQFALPNDERWYYYDWGPSLRVIVLFSDPSKILGAQRSWLENVLNSTPQYMWKIVMFHRNVYQSSLSHAGADDIRNNWVPLFDKYHVNLVVQGHTHHYYRTEPMYNNNAVYTSREGTIYLTAGGWGAPLHNYDVQQSFSAYGNSTYHFVLVNSYRNGSLHFEAKDINGHTFDSFWLHSPLKYWDFPNGMYVRVQDANITQTPNLSNDNLTVSIGAIVGTSSTLNVFCASRGSPLTVLGLSSWSYDSTFKMLTATDIQCNGTKTMFFDWVNHTQLGPSSGPERGPWPVVKGRPRVIPDANLESDTGGATTEMPTIPAVLVYGFAAFLAAGLLISVFGMILEKRKLSQRSGMRRTAR